jgi:predicted alpha/beta-hydrolase family hydrolase
VADADLGLLLTPGAGGSRDQRILVALERALSPMPVARVDFPYRLAGRKVPDQAPVAVEHLRSQAAEFAARAGLPGNRIVLGGRSYGGRMCSMAVAAGVPAAGLVLLSYPLHPPGRPTNLRVDHFPQITVPVLLVGGSADPFGSPAEFVDHIQAIPGPVTQVWLPGGHDPRPTADTTIIDAVNKWLTTLDRGENRP